MSIAHRLIRSLLALLALLVAAPAALAQPGPPANSVVNDQKAGSVLIYNYFTSTLFPGGASQDTRISLTNTHRTVGVSVHLFFVDGATCSATDSFVCLTPNQTTTFLASDVDPSVTGYIIAVAVDERGFPINFNYLIGEEYVKLASGAAAKFNAVAIAALFNKPLKVYEFRDAQLAFDGKSYEQVPRVLALSNIPSPNDGNSTLLVLNRIGGDLRSGGSRASLGNMFLLLYDDRENGFSSTFTVSTCQFTSLFSENFPRVIGGFTNVIPSGRSGWMQFYNYTYGFGILGAAINFNQNAATVRTAFNGGDNLHHLALTIDSLIIPVSTPECGVGK
jgi:hypothetical protein